MSGTDLLSSTAGGAAAGTAIMPGWGTAIGAGVGLVGSALGFLGQKSTNAANAASVAAQIQAQQGSQAESERFGQEQAQLARNFDQSQFERGIEVNQAQAEAGRQFAALSQRGAMEFDDAQRQSQNAWLSNMSNTAYQRSVKDMKAAGLNPILGVASGGASTPNAGAPTIGAVSGPTASAGSSPSSPSPSVSGISGASYRASNALSEGINTGLSALRTIQDVSQSAAQVDRIKAETSNLDADTINKGLTQGQINAQIENIWAQKTANEKAALLDEARAKGIPSQITEALASASNSAAQAARARQDQQFVVDHGFLPGRDQTSISAPGFSWSGPTQPVQRALDALGALITGDAGAAADNAKNLHHGR